MFKTLKNNDLLVVPPGEYIEVEILAEFSYPNLYVIGKKREEPCDEFLSFTPGIDTDKFEITGKRIIFKLNAGDYLDEDTDYLFTVTGVTSEGQHEEILRYTCTIRHC